MSTETVLITGASAGIGVELARRFAADGSRLVLIARREDRLNQFADALRQKFGVEVRVVAADLAQPDASQAIFDRIVAEGVEVDVLVNNAGFGAVGPVASLDVHRQMDMVAVNVVALTKLTRLFLPGMVARRRGGVLNVGSTAGFQPGPFMAVYYATKAFVLSFTEALVEELLGSGVSATCLCPGPTVTEFAAVADIEKTWLFSLGPMTAAEVARQGHRGFRRGRAIVIPGILNRVGAFSVRLAPRWFVRKFTRRLQWSE